MLAPLPKIQSTIQPNQGLNLVSRLLAPMNLFAPPAAAKPATRKAPDTLQLSPATRRSSQLANTMPGLAPVSNKTSEQLVFAGVPATINWDQRFKPASSAPRIPNGYTTVKGTLPKGLSQAASHILKQGNPLGTYTPFTLNGKNYVALNEYHTHYASRPKDPPGQIYAITVFEKA